jgi:hydrogenase-1 operon protein HyaE
MSDLIQVLADHPASEVVRRSTYAEFVARHPHVVLFFTGDLATHPEARDIAIVVRELLRQHDGRLTLGLVDRRDETALMAKSGVVVLPALAFLAHGQTVDVVARMRDWDAYAQAIERLFQSKGETTT